jgi:hypothetical protein
MNKEQEELVDEAYDNFEKWYNEHSGKKDYTGYYVPYKEEFIRLIKMDNQFSEKWGLEIEERELSLEERYKIALPIWKEKYGLLANMMVPTNVDNTPYKIPTKLITITYNDKKIESYE